MHPQHWPEDLDYTGKRVVVIGSGATAVTLDPGDGRHGGARDDAAALADYVMPLPSEDAIANGLRAAARRQAGLRDHPAQEHRCSSVRSTGSASAIRVPPKRVIRYLNARLLPKGYPVDEHFRPAYNPWDQRLCVVPDGDLFKAISAGDASIVTDRIAPSPSAASSSNPGAELEADIIVTATGLNLQAFGGVTMTVDGKR